MRTTLPLAPLRRPFSLAFCFLLSFNCSLFSQRLTGKITNNEQVPLIGATVTIKETGRSTQSDGTGHFTIDANRGDVITVSFIGYQTRELTIDDKTELDIALEQAAKTLDDVVVIGYGTSKRKDLTGA